MSISIGVPNQGRETIIDPKIPFGIEIAPAIGTGLFVIKANILLDTVFAEAMGTTEVDGVIEELAAYSAAERVVEFKEFLLIKGNGSGVTFVEKSEYFEWFILDDILLLLGHVYWLKQF